MKRIISSILAVCMLIAILPCFPADTFISASAASAEQMPYAEIDLTGESIVTNGVSLSRSYRGGTNNSTNKGASFAYDSTESAWKLNCSTTSNFDDLILKLEEGFFAGGTVGNVKVQVELKSTGSGTLKTKYENNASASDYSAATETQTLGGEGWTTYTATLDSLLSTTRTLNTKYHTLVSGSLDGHILLETSNGFKGTIYIKSIKVYAEHTCEDANGDFKCDYCKNGMSYAEIDLTGATAVTDGMTYSVVYRNRDNNTGASFAYGTAPDSSATPCWVLDGTGTTSFSSLWLKLGSSFYESYTGGTVKMEVEYYSSNNIALSTEYRNTSNGWSNASEYVKTGAEGTGQWTTYTATLTDGVNSSTQDITGNYAAKYAGDSMEGHIFLHAKASGVNLVTEKIYIRSIKVYTEHTCIDGSVKDHECDFCGAILSTHKDTDGDSRCDDCNQVMDHTCGDSDPKDHKCDICDGVLSECEDTDNDHECDICGEIASSHKDEDGDHECDICGIWMHGSAEIDLTQSPAVTDGVTYSVVYRDKDNNTGATFAYGTAPDSSATPCWVLDGTGTTSFSSLWLKLDSSFYEGYTGGTVTMEVEYYSSNNIALSAEYRNTSNGWSNASESVKTGAEGTGQWATYTATLTDGVNSSTQDITGNYAAKYAGDSMEGHIFLHAKASGVNLVTEKIYIRSIKVTWGEASDSEGGGSEGGGSEGGGSEGGGSEDNAHVAELDLTQATLATDEITLSNAFRCNADATGTGMTFAAGTAPDNTACWVMDCTNSTSFNTLLIKLNSNYFTGYKGGMVKLEVEYYSSNNIAMSAEYNKYGTGWTYASEAMNTKSAGTGQWATYTATLTEGLDPSAGSLNTAYYRLVDGELSGHILLHTKGGGVNKINEKIYIRSIKVTWEDTPAGAESDHVAELDMTQTTLAKDEITLSTAFRCNADATGSGMTFAAGTAPDGTPCWVMDCADSTSFNTLLIKLNSNYFTGYKGGAIKLEVEYYSSDNIALSAEYNKYGTGWVYAAEAVKTGTEGTNSWQTYTATLADGLNPSAGSLNTAYYRLISGELNGHILLHTKGGGVNIINEKIYIRSIKVTWDDSSPDTGDTVRPMVALLFCTTSLVACGVLLVYKKKKFIR